MDRAAPAAQVRDSRRGARVGAATEAGIGCHGDYPTSGPKGPKGRRAARPRAGRDARRRRNGRPGCASFFRRATMVHGYATRACHGD